MSPDRQIQSKRRKVPLQDRECKHEASHFRLGLKEFQQRGIGIEPARKLSLPCFLGNALDDLQRAVQVGHIFVPVNSYFP
jgi:hypothetical protein